MVAARRTSDTSMSCRHVGGQLPDQLPRRRWIDDFDVVGELHELPDSVELVVSDDDPYFRIISRHLFDGTQSTAEDPARNILSSDLEKSRHKYVLSALQTLDQKLRTTPCSVVSGRSVRTDSRTVHFRIRVMANMRGFLSTSAMSYHRPPRR